MDELLAELQDALKLSNLNYIEVKDKNDILKTVKKIFVIGNPRAWWNSLISKTESFEFEDNTGYMHLEKIIPDFLEDVFFIVDNDSEKYVFDIPFDKIKNIIQECRYFEYYIVPHDFSWLVVENDHGFILKTSALSH